MQMVFDISQDEMPIFLAEADEHLQVLDEILVEIEHLDHDSEQLHTAFRAAHTLKGMAGMIGHQRMTRLTHALETAFDGIRKDTIPVTTPLIDACLDAIDGLRMLREEVVTNEACDLDVDVLEEALRQFIEAPEKPAAAPAPKKSVEKKNGNKAAVVVEEKPVEKVPQDGAKRSLEVKANVDPKSIASAARALQLMMALQDLGEIQDMDPPLVVIETAAPVKEFRAHVLTDQDPEVVFKQLDQVSEVSNLWVEGRVEAKPTPTKAPVEVKPAAEPVAPPEAAPAAAAKPGAVRNVDMTVRTSVERLDALMNLVGELITDRNHLFQVRNRMEAEVKGNDQVENLSETVAHISRITDQLQEEVMSIRMLPIGSLFHKFPRVVRDLAQKVGKQVTVTIHGEDTELDRSMIEEINDPLIHLVRNAVDHGVEDPEVRQAAGKPAMGEITLNSWHEQGRIVVTVSDDGAGIDPDKMRQVGVQKGLITPEEAASMSDDQAVDLIFLPGFSTAKMVTDISGRGVGMDIVHTNIQRVNGTIHIETHKGQGTTFHIVLPLTLAIVPTLLVRVKNPSLPSRWSW